MWLRRSPERRLQCVGWNTTLVLNTRLRWAYKKVKGKGKIYPRTGHEGPEGE
jgi:hypothetical protein